MEGFLNSGIKSECSGCEACAQSCPVSAITMIHDDEKFSYPHVDTDKCIHCNLCHKSCPAENPPFRSEDPKVVFGGHCKDLTALEESTSGGAFSAIADAWCDNNYVIFGAEARGLKVLHSYIEDKKLLSRFRRSKYIQSEIGNSYIEAREFLKSGKKVLFSGTPCQIAGLKAFLANTDQTSLLTVEVVCEGVPSPCFIEKLADHLSSQQNSRLTELDYRYKQFKLKNNQAYGKWDFQAMKATFSDGKNKVIDRWFNPFWSIWIKHLMSRPSCYQCQYACSDRVADITLGDLWGVHIYCPELYCHNAGASLIVCNTKKGREALENAKSNLEGHELDFSTALKYQGPIRNHISANPDRDKFMRDLSNLSYLKLCRKWAAAPSVKLLCQKYLWGNRQKVWLWNLRRGNITH